MKDYLKTSRPIDPDLFYSTSELAELGRNGFFPVKTISSVIELIKSRKLSVKRLGTKKKPIYKVKGSWAISFLEKLN